MGRILGIGAGPSGDPPVRTLVSGEPRTGLLRIRSWRHSTGPQTENRWEGGAYLQPTKELVQFDRDPRLFFPIDLFAFGARW